MSEVSRFSCTPCFVAGAPAELRGARYLRADATRSLANRHCRWLFPVLANRGSVSEVGLMRLPGRDCAAHTERSPVAALVSTAHATWSCHAKTATPPCFPAQA